MLYRFLIPAILAIISLGTSALAAPSSKTRRSQPQISAEAKFEERFARFVSANVLREQENLANACKRSNPAMFVDVLREISPLLMQPRMEFETNEEFLSRNIKENEFFKSNGRTFICLKIDGYYYNIDKMAFSSNLPGGVFTTHTESRSLRSYRKRTPLGIAYNVYPTKTTRWDFNIEYDLNKNCTAGERRSFEFPYPKNAAIEFRNNGYIVLMGDIVSPYATVHHHQDEAYLDQPRPDFLTVNSVYLRASRVAVIDSVGNEVWSCASTAEQF